MKVAVAAALLLSVARTETAAVLAIPAAAAGSIGLNWVLLRFLPPARGAKQKNEPEAQSDAKPVRTVRVPHGRSPWSNRIPRQREWIVEGCDTVIRRIAGSL